MGRLGLAVLLVLAIGIPGGVFLGAYLGHRETTVGEKHQAEVQVQQAVMEKELLNPPAKRGDFLIWEDGYIVEVDRFFLTEDGKSGEFLLRRGCLASEPERFPFSVVAGKARRIIRYPAFSYSDYADAAYLFFQNKSISRTKLE